MSVFKVERVEFEPPVGSVQPKPFSGWICIGYCDANHDWFSGCDADSADDAYRELCEICDPMHHTVQMFRVDPA
jgi:hypothetical protein